MYTTIQEKVDAAGWGGVVTIGKMDYVVQGQVSGGDCGGCVLIASGWEYAGTRIVVDYGDSARGYVRVRCDVCNEPEYLRWSFTRGCVWRPVDMCTKCYNRYHKRKRALMNANPDRIKRIIDNNRMPALHVVRVITGDMVGSVRGAREW
jgi:hypothetical protein